MKLPIILVLFASSLAWSYAPVKTQLPVEFMNLQAEAIRLANLSTAQLDNGPGPIVELRRSLLSNSYRYIDSNFNNCSGRLYKDNKTIRLEGARDEDKKHVCYGDQFGYSQRLVTSIQQRNSREYMSTFAFALSPEVATYLTQRIPQAINGSYLKSLSIEFRGYATQTSSPLFRVAADIRFRERNSISTYATCSVDVEISYVDEKPTLIISQYQCLQRFPKN